MTKCFVLAGPQGIGKSTHAARIATRLGCTAVIDEWDGKDALPDGALAITNACHSMPPGGVLYRSTNKTA